MSRTGPVVVDFVAAFLLAGGCGVAGALAGRAVARRVTGESPATGRLATAALGGVFGLAYPVAWVVALDAVDQAAPGASDVPLGGGLPAVVAAAALGAILLGLLTAVRVRAREQARPAAAGLLVAATFAVVLAVATRLLLPILVPRMVA